MYLCMWACAFSFCDEISQLNLIWLRKLHCEIKCVENFITATSRTLKKSSKASRYSKLLHPAFLQLWKQCKKCIKALTLTDNHSKNTQSTEKHFSWTNYAELIFWITLVSWLIGNRNLFNDLMYTQLRQPFTRNAFHQAYLNMQ